MVDNRSGGITYWDTYAPVVSWSSVRILMTLANLHGLHTKAVDFIQAYPQAKIKAVIFLKTPPGVILESEGGREMVLLLLELVRTERRWFDMV